ncbi:unnamed protein product [Heterosigma akashiwo]
MISRVSVVKKLGHRAVNWAAISSKLTSDSAKAELNRYKALCGEIQGLYKAASAAPAPIDFAAYRAKLGAAHVDGVESAYKAAAVPAYGIGWIRELEAAGAFAASPELQALHADLSGFVADAAGFQASHDAIVAEANEAVAASEARVAELEALIATMEGKKIGLDTTVADVLARHPEIEKEVDEEINNHEWAKDTM